MTKSKAWMSWSSGKDSAWALHQARQQGELEANNSTKIFCWNCPRAPILARKTVNFTPWCLPAPMFGHPLSLQAGEIVEKSQFIFADFKLAPAANLIR